MIRNSFITGVLIILAIVVIVLLYGGTALTAPYKSSGIKARLTGHGISDSLNIDLTIAAILRGNGEVEGSGDVHGVSLIPPNFKGRVVELVPPSANKDYWCVNLTLFNASEEFNGFNWLWFVKDLPSGDMLSFAGDYSLTCAAAGTPTQPFEAITRGGYNGFVK
ncbi:MAG: hypothetical protein HYT12_02600 [Candidatus Liptonbacteria bacterium]|nr:hypothetical protein [Candidatus Liptonbacteria bacterium]